MTDEKNFKVMSFNIRYENEEQDSNNNWYNRKDFVAQIIKEQDPDVIGLQEGIPKQMNQLFHSSILQNEFQWDGLQRSDWEKTSKGLESETSGVAFKTSRFERLDGGTFWLSSQPSSPSKLDHSDFNRICTWAKLKDKRNGGNQFFLFNTHLDYSTRKKHENGRMARVDQMEVILEQIEKITRMQFPVFLSGDWNTDLHPKDPLIRYLETKGEGRWNWKMTDSEELSENGHQGETITYQGFGNEEWNDEWKPAKVDWIFFFQPLEGPQIAIRSHVTLPDPPKQKGTLPSDHRPIYVDCYWK